MSNGQLRPTALVTGASGFVGGHLVSRLRSAQWHIHAVVIEKAPLSGLAALGPGHIHWHDGTTESLVQIVKRSAPDVVFHLASAFVAEHNTRDVEPLIASNVFFGTQLLEAMAVNSVTRIVNTGTSWQHYQSDSYRPVCLYAATKQAFEALLHFYVDGHDLKAITLKLFDTYGPGDCRPKLFSLLRRAWGEASPLDMSPGEQLLDLVYVEDVVEAFLMAAQRLLAGQVSSQEEYAVSSARPLPLRQVAAIYADVLGVNLNLRWGARPYRAREVMVPWNSGKPLPGWAPKIPLDEGIRRSEAYAQSDLQGELDGHEKPSLPNALENPR